MPAREGTLQKTEEARCGFEQDGFPLTSSVYLAESRYFNFGTPSALGVSGKGYSLTAISSLTLPPETDMDALFPEDLKVLVVDDEETVRHVLSDLLSLLGLSVVSVADGFEALKVLSSGGIGLIFTDRNMQPMGGIELIRRVKDFAPHLPIVMVSGTHETDTSERNRPDAFLAKPFSFDQVNRAVQSAIKASR